MHPHDRRRDGDCRKDRKPPGQITANGITGQAGAKTLNGMPKGLYPQYQRARVRRDRMHAANSAQMQAQQVQQAAIRSRRASSISPAYESPKFY